MCNSKKLEWLRIRQAFSQGNMHASHETKCIVSVSSFTVSITLKHFDNPPHSGGRWGGGGASREYTAPLCPPFPLLSSCCLAELMSVQRLPCRSEAAALRTVTGSDMIKLEVLQAAPDNSSPCIIELEQYVVWGGWEGVGGALHEDVVFYLY